MYTDCLTLSLLDARPVCRRQGGGVGEHVGVISVVVVVGVVVCGSVLVLVILVGVLVLVVSIGAERGGLDVGGGVQDRRSVVGGSITRSDQAPTEAEAVGHADLGGAARKSPHE